MTDKVREALEAAREWFREPDLAGDEWSTTDWLNRRKGALAKIDAALAALDAPAEGDVKIKPLVWEDRGLGILYADSVVGSYKVNRDGYWWRDDGPIEGRGGQDAVEADYERRIRFALVRESRS